MNLLKLFKCVVIAVLGVQCVCRCGEGWGSITILAFLLTVGDGSLVDEETFWALARGCGGESHVQRKEGE